jgi:hypothetical protein
MMWSAPPAERDSCHGWLARLLLAEGFTTRIMHAAEVALLMIDSLPPLRRQARRVLSGAAWRFVP